MIIREIRPHEYSTFKAGIQEAFQQGFERYYGKTNGVIIPDEDIYSSYSMPDTVSYVAIEDGEIIGGCIVQINEDTNVNDLHILYAKVGVQSKGIGYVIWKEMERLYPNTKTWRTCTPYFDRRNIHFYINKCGFHAVKFLSEQTDDPNFIGDHGEGMFEFEKNINQ